MAASSRNILLVERVQFSLVRVRSGSELFRQSEKKISSYYTQKINIYINIQNKIKFSFFFLEFCFLVCFLFLKVFSFIATKKKEFN